MEAKLESLAPVAHWKRKPLVSELIMIGSDLIALGVLQLLGIILCCLLQGRPDLIKPFWLLMLLFSAGLAYLKLYAAVRLGEMRELRHGWPLPGPLIIKHIIDITASFALGVLTLPLCSLLALLIRLESPGPALYGHWRIGLNSRCFRVWKFRSMVLNGDSVLREHLAKNPGAAEEWARDRKLKEDPRITRIGRFLRKTSLDELPQLVNILKGEMSLVGPRPIVPDEVPKYGNNIALYTRVLPGLTGLWQVSGRNNTTYQRRVHLDAYYVRHWSPRLDLYVLARTVRVVLLCEGAY